MSVHDAWARLTPYELSFPDLAFARGHFAAIREEAGARQTDLHDAAAFVMLAASGQALREIRGPDDDPALIRQYGSLLYHAFHFHAAGEPLWLVRVPALRALLGGAPDAPDAPDAAGWVPALEPAAGYAQLPQHMVWVRSSGDDPPESLDGFFWARSGAGRFDLLLALGMRGDRPGLSVVPLADLPVADAAEWVTSAMREGGGDFASSLPGSELEGLYELRSGGEALKLAALVLRALERVPAAALTEPAAAADLAPVGPRASELPYRSLDGA